MNDLNPKKLLLEGVVIVLSILAAFLLDATWEGLQERELEKKHLIAMKTDFEETLVRIETATKATEANRELAIALMDLEVQKTGDELDTAIVEVFAIHTLEPVTGAIQELITSGELSSIQDRDLRQKLAAWESSVELYRKQEQYLFNDFYFHFSPFLVQKTDFGQLMRIHYTEIPKSIRNRDHQSLLSDSEFRNILTLRWVHSGDVLHALRGLRTSTEEILECLSSGIEE